LEQMNWLVSKQAIAPRDRRRSAGCGIERIDFDTDSDPDPDKTISEIKTF